MRRAAIATLVLVALPATADVAVVQGSAAVAARAALDFAVRIPPVLRLRAAERTGTVVVAAGASVVEVPEAASLEILTNVAASELRIELRDADVAFVEVEGLGPATLRVTREGTAVPVGTPGPATLRRHDLRYRIHLAPGAAIGPRALPLAFSLQAS